MNIFISMTQGLTSSAMATPMFQGGYGNATMPNNMIVNSSTIAVPLIQGGYDNTTVPCYMVGNSSTMSAPYIQGGYTSLLLGVDQNATSQSAVRQLHFDGGSSNHENM